MVQNRSLSSVWEPEPKSFDKDHRRRVTSSTPTATHFFAFYLRHGHDETLLGKDFNF